MSTALTARASASMRVGALARCRRGGYRARSTTTTTRAGERYMATERVRVRENADGGVTYSFDEDAPPAAPVETETAAVETVEPVVAETPTATVEKELTWVGETTTTTTTEETPVVEEEAVQNEEKDAAATESVTKAPPISKMKKAELIALCESLGLDSSGTVAALRGRLGPAVRGRAA